MRTTARYCLNVISGLLIDIVRSLFYFVLDGMLCLLLGVGVVLSTIAWLLISIAIASPLLGLSAVLSRVSELISIIGGLLILLLLILVPAAVGFAAIVFVYPVERHNLDFSEYLSIDRIGLDISEYISVEQYKRNISDYLSIDRYDIDISEYLFEERDKPPLSPELAEINYPILLVIPVVLLSILYYNSVFVSGSTQPGEVVFGWVLVVSLLYRPVLYGIAASRRHSGYMDRPRLNAALTIYPGVAVFIGFSWLIGVFQFILISFISDGFSTPPVIFEFTQTSAMIAAVPTVLGISILLLVGGCLIAAHWNSIRYGMSHGLITSLNVVTIVGITIYRFFRYVTLIPPKGD